MKNFTQNDYAVNKNAEGIVYRFSDQTVEVTLNDYLRENPDKAAADFEALKALSDDDYYESDRRDYRQTWKNTSFEALDEDELAIFAAPSAEETVIGQSETKAAYAKRQATASHALEKLTDTQRRRYQMYHVDGLTMRQIADIEGVLHSKIQKSLEAAERKIKKIVSGQ